MRFLVGIFPVPIQVGYLMGNPAGMPWGFHRVDIAFLFNGQEPSASAEWKHGKLFVSA